jgi:hypothetical protein
MPTHSASIAAAAIMLDRSGGRPMAGNHWRGLGTSRCAARDQVAVLSRARRRALARANISDSSACAKV